MLIKQQREISYLSAPSNHHDKSFIFKISSHQVRPGETVYTAQNFINCTRMFVTDISSTPYLDQVHPLVAWFDESVPWIANRATNLLTQSTERFEIPFALLSTQEHARFRFEVFFKQTRTVSICDKLYLKLLVLGRNRVTSMAAKYFLVQDSRYRKAVEAIRECFP